MIHLKTGCTQQKCILTKLMFILSEKRHEMVDDGRHPYRGSFS